MTEPEQDQAEPEPNTQLSEYGKLMRARFELADKNADSVLPKAFATGFRSTMRDLLERDWNYFGAVDSLVVNAQIPYVNDVLRCADQKGLLSDKDKQLVPAEVSR